MKKIILITTVLLLITGCVTNDLSDLKAFVKKTKATYKGKVKALPEFKHQPPYVYNARSIRDPFKPVVDIEVASGAYRGPKPDENRPKEPLEEFPLDSLRMVGTLSLKEADSVLIKDPDGLLHRVSIGHYMGQNFGKVISVNEEEISLLEWYEDNKKWEQREASIALSE